MINFLAFFWASFTILKVNGTIPRCLDSRQEESRQLSPRGYGYGGFGYPFLPFLEPLSILAVLGFLAYLVQAFHTLYYGPSHGAGLGGGLAGGLLSNVLPGHPKNVQSESRQNDNSIRTEQFYETLNKHRKNKKRTKFAKGEDSKIHTKRKTAG